MVIDKKNHYIYLAGGISNNPATYEWREKFRELAGEKCPHMIILDPTLNNFNQKMRKNKNAGVGFVKDAVRKSQKLLRAKDYQLIRISSIMVVNLEIVDENKPLIGTVMELAWARDIFYIPVIAIVGKNPNIYGIHPWIDECCSAKVESVDDAVKILDEFFKGY